MPLRLLSQPVARGSLRLLRSRRPPVSFDFSGGTLPAAATLTRAGTGWSFNSGLVLTSYATNVARWAYDPAGAGLLGLLVEAAATNALRNSSASGTVAGTPGTSPTNWSAPGTINGVTRQIVGTGSEDGIPYIDIRYFGTPTATSGTIIIFESTTQVAAASGQQWAASVYLRLVAGSLSGIPLPGINTRLHERSNTGTNLAETDTNNIPLTAAALKTQRIITLRTFNQATTAFTTSAVAFSYTTGTAIDLTLRIGSPQLEQQAVASSPIPTTAAAVTRPADVLTLATTPGTYDIQIQRRSGSTLLAATAVGTSYVVPSDPSPLVSVVMQ